MLLNALFPTRDIGTDPAKIRDENVLMAMMAIAAVYEPYEVRRLNHGLVGMIYDSYFMTVRMPVARPEVVAQLLRRLVAIARDLAANGLRPPEDRDPLPEELLRPEVVKCETGLVDILFEIGRIASGIVPRGHAAPLPRGVPRAAAEAARR